MCVRKKVCKRIQQLFSERKCWEIWSGEIRFDFNGKQEMEKLTHPRTHQFSVILSGPD